MPSPSDLPKYKNPPVIEVVCGVVFNKLAAFKVPHTGLLWEKFRDEFPICEHATPLGQIQEDFFDPKSGFPLPRVWFINKDNDKLIQVQSDRFFFNWRKSAAKPDYPSYEKIIGFFQNYLNVFEKFVGENTLGNIQFLEGELTYVNHMPKGREWNAVEDVEKVFPDLVWRQKENGFLKNPTSIMLNITFPLPEEKGWLTAKLQRAKKVEDSIPIFVLEMVAKGLGEDKSKEAVFNWFDIAHTWIVKGFTDITNPDIQTKIWSRTQ